MIVAQAIDMTGQRMDTRRRQHARQTPDATQRFSLAPHFLDQCSLTQQNRTHRRTETFR